MIFNPMKTQQVNENLYVIRVLMVNFYIYKDQNTLICFDTGFLPPIIKSGLKKLGVNSDDIKGIFLTHSDYDHAGGLSLFKNGKIYISDEEEQMINGSKARLLGIKHNSKIRRNYIKLRDGEEVKVNNIKIKAIASPGHTPGSVSYLVNDEVLFVGDTMRFVQKQIKSFFPLQNMNTKQQKESIAKLMEIEGIKTICTGHHGYMHIY